MRLFTTWVCAAVILQSAFGYAQDPVVPPLLSVTNTVNSEPSGNVGIGKNAETGVVLSAENTLQKNLDTGVAFFHYQLGDYQRALLELSLTTDNNLTANIGSKVSGLDVHLQRYIKAQTVFTTLLDGEIPEELNNKISLEVAELNYAKADCEGTLNALNQTKDLPQEADHQARFLRVSCMLQNPMKSLGVVAQGESIALEAKGQSIWLAYLYYNLAVTSSEEGQLDGADRLYHQALLFSDDSSEGRSLSQKIHLSLAYAYFSVNRYDFAMDSFAALKIDTPWADQSLLGYGWAAYLNYKPGIALEAWRQLVNLPFKSLSVYEGYIAIPYALEKQNAYSEALKAYNKAVDEYSLAVEQIDKLSSGLTLDDIHRHGQEYAGSEGGYVEPLHSLLVYSYAKEEFQGVFKVVADVSQQLQELSAFEGQVRRLMDVRDKHEGRKTDIQDQYSVLIEKKLARLFFDIQLTMDKVFDISRLVEIVRLGGLDGRRLSKYQKGIEQRVLAQYTEYQRLQSRAEVLPQGVKKEALMAMLENFKGVLFWQYYEVVEEHLDKELLQLSVIRSSYINLKLRYESYSAYKNSRNKYLADETQQLEAMLLRIKEEQQQAQNVLAKAEEVLLEKTRIALEEQKNKILLFKYQARIASVRLNEQFYQKGGRKLWQ